MATVVKTRIVKIGNSRVIRIPEALLHQAGLRRDVVLTGQPNQLIVRSARRPRQGWGKQFRAMAARGDDRLLDKPCLTRWDREEWKLC